MRLSPRIIGVILIAVSIVLIVAHLVGRRTARVSNKFPGPEKIWEFTTGKPFMGDGVGEHSPSLDTDGTIYAGGDRGLYALKPGGSPKWFHEVGTQVRYTPIIYTLIDDGTYGKAQDRQNDDRQEPARLANDILKGALW